MFRSRSSSNLSRSSFRSSFRSRSSTLDRRNQPISRRQYNQFETSKTYGLDIEKHAGLGISLMWIKFNLDFRDNEASILSAINSLFALEQANEIDEEVIQRINPTFGLSDPNFKLKNPTFTAPIYNIDILFACINKSCNTRAMGFHFNRPDTSDLIEINDIVSILRKDYEFMGILLRLGPISATSGTIAVCKKGEIFKFFTHQFGETSVSSDLLNEFFEDLSRRAAMMNYKHACLFEVNALSPKFSSRRTASASGSGGTR